MRLKTIGLIGVSIAALIGLYAILGHGDKIARANTTYYSGPATPITDKPGWVTITDKFPSGRHSTTVQINNAGDEGGANPQVYILGEDPQPNGTWRKVQICSYVRDNNDCMLYGDKLDVMTAAAFKVAIQHLDEAWRNDRSKLRHRPD